MRRAISSSLTRCVGAAGVTSALLQLPQHRLQSQAPPGGLPQSRQQAPKAAHAGHEHSHPPEPEVEPPRKPTEMPKFVRINTNDKGITNVQLARSPVNSLSLEFLQELNQWMLWLGSNEETKAVVISSAVPTVYSAGLDLAEVHKPNPERLSTFWQNVQQLWISLNTFPKTIIAAITGSAPAAGCIIAMGCDYRVMARGPKDNTKITRQYHIGLNETKLGLVAPPWTVPAYCHLLGSRQAERMLQLGETPLADDAHKLGLIDEVAPDEERTIEAAYKQADRFLSVPQKPRLMSRELVRGGYMQMLASDKDRKRDTDAFMNTVLNPEVQQSLERYLERLKSRSRK